MVALYHYRSFSVLPWCEFRGITMGAGTGIILIDYLARPLLRFGFKFYAIGFTILFLVYGYIAYKAVKSAYLADRGY